MVDLEKIREKLAEADLKVTPQRIAVFQALDKLNKQHPTTDQVLTEVRNHHPAIATGTVYKILDTFVEKRIVCRVRTEDDIMRYDMVMSEHHHIYDTQTGRIIDYHDEELNKLIRKYLEDNHIPHFDIDQVKLSIMGHFKPLHKPNTN